MPRSTFPARDPARRSRRRTGRPLEDQSPFSDERFTLFRMVSRRGAETRRVSRSLHRAPEVIRSVMNRRLVRARGRHQNSQRVEAGSPNLALCLMTFCRGPRVLHISLPTNLMLNLLPVPHSGPAEFICWKRPLIRVDLSQDLAVKAFLKFRGITLWIHLNGFFAVFGGIGGRPARRAKDKSPAIHRELEGGSEGATSQAV